MKIEWIKGEESLRIKGFSESFFERQKLEDENGEGSGVFGRYTFSSVNEITGCVHYVGWQEQAYVVMGHQHVVAVIIQKDICFIFEFYLEIHKIKG